MWACCGYSPGVSSHHWVDAGSTWTTHDCWCVPQQGTNDSRCLGWCRNPRKAPRNQVDHVGTINGMRRRRRPISARRHVGVDSENALVAVAQITAYALLARLRCRMRMGMFVNKSTHAFKPLLIRSHTHTHTRTHARTHSSTDAHMIQKHMHHCIHRRLACFIFLPCIAIVFNSGVYCTHTT